MDSKLNEFEILNKLGEGSFGLVFKVRRKLDRQIYVMKQINISKMNQRMKNDALNEATILSKLDSQYIVKYYESFIDKNLLCIVMEFCEGGDLHRYLKMQMGRHLTENQVWRILIQTTLGLAYLHKLKILHRDIKAMNIFLAKDTVRIGDLGVAKILSDQNNFARTMVGTPYYLSPEMCEEKPYNEKSDIWALGCVIYELCTFKHPFEAQNQGALVLKILRGRYDSIPTTYSSPLGQVIDLCLQKDYRSRPDAYALLQQTCVLNAASSLRLTLSLNQPHPQSKQFKDQAPPQQTPSSKPIPGTPVQVSVKAINHKPIKAKGQPVQLEVKGKEAQFNQQPVRETPVIARKEVREIKEVIKEPKQEDKQNVIYQNPEKMGEFYQDWRDKVQELQKGPPPRIEQQPVLQPNKNEQLQQQQQIQPKKKPIVKTVDKQMQQFTEKRRIRKGAPQELGRQAQNAQNQKKKPPQQQQEVQNGLQLLKRKQNQNQTISKQYTNCSPEEIEQVLNLPDTIIKTTNEQEVIEPKKQIIDLSAFLSDQQDHQEIPTISEEQQPLQENFLQFEEEEEDVQVDEQDDTEEQELDSDKEVYTEGEEENNDNDSNNDNTIEYGENENENETEAETQDQSQQQESQVEFNVDSKKFELNKKIVNLEKRKMEIEQIVNAKTKESIRDLGQKLFDEVISFLREKLNSQNELNEKDQEEIDDLMTGKLLKTRNPKIIYTIYQILHFEIEFQNTIEQITRITQELENL